MIPGRIEGATRAPSEPADWDAETQGSCSALAIKDDVWSGTPVMLSVWHPTPGELEKLNAGAGVVLCICGTVHPPVWLSAGNPPPSATSDE